MSSLSDLDFQPGRAFHEAAISRFGPGTLITCCHPSDDFFLIASFSCSALRINADSTALVLQSLLGGSILYFQVVHQDAWCFHFSVASKHVGLMIHRMAKFVCKEFAIFFTLWRNGGPDYMREELLWNQMQEAGWNHVHRKKKSYAEVARSHSTHLLIC
uniref:Uncharacterized protein n=1 Tax=Setaria italica TaxID=4555 RepID=K3ZDY8_SETIT